MIKIPQQYNFTIFKTGSLVECQMTNYDDSPSEWTKSKALILEDLSYGELSPYSDYFYKVYIDKQVLYMNHACFVSGAYDWKMLKDFKYRHYL